MLHRALLKNIKNKGLMPGLFIIFLGLGHLLFQGYGAFCATKLHFAAQLALIQVIEHAGFFILLGLCTYWILSSLIEAVFSYFYSRLDRQKRVNFSIILHFFETVLKVLSFLILFNLVTQAINLPDKLSFVLSKLSSILIICSISIILFKLIALSETFLLRYYEVDSGKIAARKMHTQILILKRVAYSIVLILTAGSIFMLFDNVRTLGASVLTTAGIIGLVLSFAAQKSLGSIFASLELALTQPIKIGDKIQIGQDVGTVEEINFRSVIIKLWNWRHLVVPTQFFLEKSFENWTRVEPTNLLGSVYLYVDFTMPVAQLRAQLHFILEQNALWDKNIAQLQVNKLQKTVMELKILVSARNSDDLTQLSSQLREELMGFIVEQFPGSLPKARTSEIKNLTQAHSKDFAD